MSTSTLPHSVSTVSALSVADQVGRLADMFQDVERERVRRAARAQQAPAGFKVPTRQEVDALMKRCQRGVGGRDALDDAHNIMAECYGTLGALMLGIELLEARLSAAPRS